MSEWLDYKEAAELMHRPASYLRERNADGVTFKYFPSIERWQPGGKGTRLFVKLDHVLAWIEASKGPAPKPREFSGLGYESALPTLRRLGAPARVMRAFGLKS